MSPESISRGHKTKVAVVGGGITGLAAAWEASSNPDIRVEVFESTDRLGGKISSSPMDALGGIDIDEAADAFLARVPEAIALCEELGLGDSLVTPDASVARILLGSELRAMPADTVLGVPVEFDAMDRSGLVSRAGMERARAEVDRDWKPPSGDVSIGAFLSERYGREVVDNVVSPLIGGINAGNVDALSLQAVTPQLAAAAARGGSLTNALRSARDRRANPAPAEPAGVFRGLVGGMTTLIAALESALAQRGVVIHRGERVTSLALRADAVEIRTGGTAWAPTTADALVVSADASTTAAIIGSLDSTEAAHLAGLLGSITYSSVALVTMVYSRADLAHLDPQMSGVLIPRTAGMLTTAVSVGTNKWSSWDDGEHVVLRASAGHSSDDRAETIDDEVLVSEMTDELGSLLAVHAPPQQVRISRWINGFAQYRVGHLDLISSIESSLATLTPRIRIAGASFRGLGIPSCIGQGRSAARAVLEEIA